MKAVHLVDFNSTRSLGGVFGGGGVPWKGWGYRGGPYAGLSGCTFETVFCPLICG